MKIVKDFILNCRNKVNHYTYDDVVIIDNAKKRMYYFTGELLISDMNIEEPLYDTRIVYVSVLPYLLGYDYFKLVDFDSDKSHNGVYGHISNLGNLIRKYNLLGDDTIDDFLLHYVNDYVPETVLDYLNSAYDSGSDLSDRNDLSRDLLLEINRLVEDSRIVFSSLGKVIDIHLQGKVVGIHSEDGDINLDIIGDSMFLNDIWRCENSYTTVEVFYWYFRLCVVSGVLVRL